MLYYAIRNKRTKRFVSGTDFRYHPHHQIYADKTYRSPLLLPIFRVDYEVRHRQINLNSFEIVEVGLNESRICSDMCLFDTDRIIKEEIAQERSQLPSE